MKKTIKVLPIPITGLMLALAACGNLLLSYGKAYRNIFGIMSSIILLLILIKIFISPKDVMENLKNPVVASVFPTLSMGIMILSTYINFKNLSFITWCIGLGLHVLFIIIFTFKYVFNFNIKQVFPSWFIVYVGIATASVTGPSFNMSAIGRGCFWFALIAYLILMPVILYRVFKVKELPEPTLPTLVIFSAPASLCLAGYLSSFQQKNMVIVYTLLIISQLTLAIILFKLPSLLKLKFYPSYSAFTFPIVISGISLKLANNALINSNNTIIFLKYMVNLEELLAVTIVIYVLINYIVFLTSNKKSVKA